MSVAWNPANVQIKAGCRKLAKCFKKTDVLIINQDEAKELVLSVKKIKKLAIRVLLKEIYKMGPKIVAITVGPKGAYAYDGKRVYYQKEMPAKVINATGAGDSFSAGFVSSLFYQPENIKQALRWGVANSTSVIKKLGAQKGLLTKSQIKKR
ncbi:carbohydrate kinase family protein [Patescibacteria group bacterium]|nr:carbohydrate kinase family protein [Patescibacteria group bacterium]